MKLIHNDLETVISFSEHIVNSLVVESPVYMRNLISDLTGQIAGNEGGFVLSKSNSTELSLGKEGEFIFNPLIDSNSNKVFATKLLQSLRVIAHNEHHFEKTAELESVLLRYASVLMQSVDESLMYNDSIDTLALLKVLGFSLDFEDADPIENLITYVKASNKHFGKTIFFFLNIKSFFELEELEYLVNTIHAMKCNLLFIENQRHKLFLKNEKCSIIDVDFCEIF